MYVRQGDAKLLAWQGVVGVSESSHHQNLNTKNNDKLQSFLILAAIVTIAIVVTLIQGSMSLRMTF